DFAVFLDNLVNADCFHTPFLC
ncbi:MAG: hypothetical protein HW378_4069, partial [Anaerolineales bacterium]|nr:hypothetical protein [Anaerolineales bacterium]